MTHFVFPISMAQKQSYHHSNHLTNIKVCVPFPFMNFVNIVVQFFVYSPVQIWYSLQSVFLQMSSFNFTLKNRIWQCFSLLTIGIQWKHHPKSCHCSFMSYHAHMCSCTILLLPHQCIFYMHQVPIVVDYCTKYKENQPILF